MRIEYNPEHPQPSPAQPYEAGLMQPNRAAAALSGRPALGQVLYRSGDFRENGEIDAFDNLRTDVYDRMGQAIVERLTNNPTPTPEERLMGTYIEALEPQVHNATMTMRAKGYNTLASGFHNTNDDWRVLGIDNPARTYDPLNRRGQVMNFDHPLQLAPETKQRLNEMGVETLEWPDEPGTAVIGFSPTSPDIESITGQWDAIAEVLPDTGAPAGPRMGSLEATHFGIYCPPDINWPTAVFNDVASQAAASFDASAGFSIAPGGEAAV
jgi:hypothetical protein